MPEVAKAGGKLYTFHLEATRPSLSPSLTLLNPPPENPSEMVDLIHSHSMLAGLAISPETPSSSITDTLGNSVDLLLVMTVRPGRGGQKFMPECLEKVAELRKRFPEKNIQVDGGVGVGNAFQCAEAGRLVSWGCEAFLMPAIHVGSNVLVAGTAIFGSKDPAKTIAEMRSAVDETISKRR